MTAKKILLVGSGYMGVEYAKVLKDLNLDFIVSGRSETSAKHFEKVVGVRVITGGIDKFLNQKIKIPSIAIVAVSEDQLGIVAQKLIHRGVKKILLEKPGGADFEEIIEVKKQAKKNNVAVYLAYNRRFYSSVAKAVDIIKKDGGILSIFFDFTEAVHKIIPLVRAPGVKENWFLHNSTHVIDLAFFLGGTPKKICSFTSGSLSWHSKAALFTGAGITKKGALFAYHADWKGPGRWGVEVVTKKHKLFFKPLEKLQIQQLGSFEIQETELNDNMDIEFKPGIYKQVRSFFGNKKGLCTISEQVENLKYYHQILSGNTSI